MNIGIIGLGLIGGSLGMSLLEKTQHKVFGRDVDSDSMKMALLSNAVHKELLDEDLSSLDVVILAVFPHIACEILDDILPKLKAGAIVCDICGIKEKIIEKFELEKARFPHIKFVGTHPMAGREYYGIMYAISTLFDKAFGILTPVLDDMESARKIEKLFLEIGFVGCVFADATRHDEMIAYTSQLAHVVSSCYVKNPLSLHHVGFSAGSFKDMTRVARLNPEMWTELFSQNHKPLARHIDSIILKLQEYSRAIHANDQEEIFKLLSEGTSAKESADENYAEHCRLIGREFEMLAEN